MKNFYYDNETRSYYLNNTEILPATVAMSWCMDVTCVNRIFCKEHLEEFLYRLAYVLNSKNILEKWLLEDKLFDFSYEGTEYEFSVKDIEQHLGMENHNSYIDIIERSLFFEKMVSNVSLDSFIYLTQSFILLVETKSDGDNVTSLVGTSDIEKKLPANEDEIREKALFFSNEIIKNINIDTFSKANNSMKEKLEELRIRKEKIKNYPTFDFEKIALKTLHDCIKASFSDEDAQEILDNPDDDIRYQYKRYIYLAWLFANGFMVSDYTTADEVEGITINYNDYDEDGINLLNFYWEYNLKAMEPYLKGLFFEK
jgi:hypothetical protein